MYNVKFNDTFYDGIQQVTNNVTSEIEIYTEDNFTSEQKKEIIGKLKSLNKNNVSWV